MSKDNGVIEITIENSNVTEVVNDDFEIVDIAFYMFIALYKMAYQLGVDPEEFFKYNLEQAAGLKEKWDKERGLE